MKKRWKRVIAAVLVFALSINSAYVPFTPAANHNMGTVCAAGTGVWSGKVDTSWYTGDKDSYDISTAEQLAGFAKLVDEAAHDDRFRGVTINLTSDIVLNDTKNFSNWSKKAPKNKWEPIGHQGSAVMGYNPFAGVFNGNGHTITGLYTKNTDYGFWGTTSREGFFECICGAAVTNLKFEKAYVESSGSAGVLAAVSEGSYVSGITVNNSKVVSEAGRAGGIIGSCHQFVNTYLMSFLILGLMGIFINPILYADDAAKEILGEHGTLIADCRVNNLTIQRNKKYGSGTSGGIVGGGRVGVYNSLVSYYKVNNPEESCGIIVGADPNNNKDVALKQCSYYGCEINKPANSKVRKFIDKKYVKQTKKNTIIKVGAKKSALTVKNIRKKSAKISLKCKSNSTAKLTYKVTSTPKNGLKYIKVSTSGKVLIKKKAKKGTYVITIYAQENDRYAATKKTVSIKVK